jgi:hypothetical protein
MLGVHHHAQLTFTEVESHTALLSHPGTLILLISTSQIRRFVGVSTADSIFCSDTEGLNQLSPGVCLELAEELTFINMILVKGM